MEKTQLEQIISESLDNVLSSDLSSYIIQACEDMVNAGVERG